MGAMGARMAATLLAAGHEVMVWNRDKAKTAPLVAAGAVAADTPAIAVREADFVISMVRDDEASQQVWLHPATGALAAMPKTAIAIESSTLTVAWVQELAAASQTHGLAFLDAPVAGSQPQAEARQLIYLVGGAPAVVESASPVLLTMGGALHHAGPVGSGTTMKLLVNALFGLQVAALGELLQLGQRLGVDGAKIVEILAATPVLSPAAKAAAGGMVAGNFAPMFPITLVEKDFAYVVNTAEAVGAEVPLAEATRQIFAEALAQGLGDLNITGIARRYQ